MGPEPPWLLVEMLREAERVSDRILRMAEEQDDKTEHTIALGVAVLGGGLVLATFAAEAQLLDGISVLPLAAASVANLMALTQFVQAYLGVPRASLTVAPDPTWLLTKADDADWTSEAHLFAVLRAHALNVHANLRGIRLVVLRRQRGARFLLGALALFAIAAFYIVARVVSA